MSQHSQRTELLVGLFVLFGLGVLAVLGLSLGGLGSRFAEHYPLTLEVSDASGLSKGAPVRFGGADIGRVGGTPELKEDLSGLVVPLRIRSDREVPEGAIFSVASSGLMGDAYVRIQVPEQPSGRVLAPGALVVGETAAGFADLSGSAMRIAGKASGALDDFSRLAQRVDAFLLRIENGVLDEERLAALDGILGDMGSAARRFDSVMAGLESAIDELEPALAEAGGFFERADGTFAKADGLLDEAGAEMDGLADVGDAVLPVADHLDRVATNLDSAAAGLKSSLRDLDRLLAKVESGDGAASALLNDGEMRADLASFLDKLERHGVLGYPREGGILSGLPGGAARRGRGAGGAAKTANRPEARDPGRRDAEKGEKKRPFSLFRKQP